MKEKREELRGKGINWGNKKGGRNIGMGE